MARPQKESDDKRTLTVRVRVTATEKQRIWQMAADAGQTPSDYMRVRSLASVVPLRRVPTPDRAVLLHGLAQLGRLGSNVNQIARACNASRESGQLTGVSPDEIHQAMQGVDALTTRLLNLLGDGHSG